jgi:hypothetical protein
VVRVPEIANTIFDPSYGTIVTKSDSRTVEQKYEDLNVISVLEIDRRFPPTDPRHYRKEVADLPGPKYYLSIP